MGDALDSNVATKADLTEAVAAVRTDMAAQFAALHKQLRLMAVGVVGLTVTLVKLIPRFWGEARCAFCEEEGETPGRSLLPPSNEGRLAHSSPGGKNLGRAFGHDAGRIDPADAVIAVLDVVKIHRLFNTRHPV